MGLKNLKVNYKINIISFFTIILLGIVTFVLYYKKRFEMSIKNGLKCPKINLKQ